MDLNRKAKEKLDMYSAYLEFILTMESLKNKSNKIKNSNKNQKNKSVNKKPDKKQFNIDEAIKIAKRMDEQTQKNKELDNKFNPKRKGN